MPRLPLSAAAFLFCISCTTGCALLFPATHSRGLLASKMINLSSAVDFYFSELPSAPIAVDDAELLAAATEHDKLLPASEFKHYQLKVEYQNSHAVLLLCNRDGDRALMEDVGCTARLDRMVSEKDIPCTFTLKVNRDCEVVGGDSE